MKASARLGRLISVAPVVCAAGYVAVLLADFRRIITDVHLNPDASWAPVLARDLGQPPRGGHILVGAASHFTTIWFLTLTRGFPFRNAIWDAAPYLMYLAALGGIAWACWRIAGRWAALLTVALGLSANAIVLLTVFSEGVHGATYVADAVLAVFLVYWATRAPERVWPARLAVVAIAVLAGTTLASDTLFLASGLGPFFGASVLLWLVRRDRRGGGIALLATGVTVAAAALSAGVNAWMADLGYRRTYETGGFGLAKGSVAWANFRKFGRLLGALGNSSLKTHPFGLRPALQLLMTVALIGAVIAVLGLLLQSVRRRAQWSGSTDDARLLYLAFWVLSGLAVCAGYSLTTFAEGPSDPTRYVAPAFFAVAATAPIWAARLGWRRVIAAVAAVVFCALSIDERHGLFTYEVFGRPAVRAQAIAFLENEGVTNGYTGYFDSHPFTLQADMRVHFYPVIACRAPVSSRLCPFYINSRTAWYVPRPGIRTFVMFDASSVLSVAAIPTPDLGTPAVTQRFGPLYIFIYNYDVASKLAPPCPADAINQLSCPYRSA